MHSPVRAFQSVGGTPIFFKKAKGDTLWDVENHSYTDFCMSFGPLLLGHRDKEITKVVKETVNLAWSFGACEPYSLELSEFICQHMPRIEKVRFVSSGTEAVMSALRLARSVTKRNGILKFEGCYHGHSDSLLVKAGSGLAEAAISDSSGVTEKQSSDTYVLPLDDEKNLDIFFKKQGKNIACAIIEPLPANHGLLIQRPEFWKKLSSLCKKHGVLLIFDEVISGFRVGLEGMSKNLSITPDLFCLGKVIGGGFPVGAYGGCKDLMNNIAPMGDVYQAGTLSANPFGMRVGLSTLKKAKRENIYELLKENTQYFCDEIKNIWQEKKIKDWDIHSYASIFWLHQKTENPIRSVSTFPTNQRESYATLFHALLKEGIYLAPSGFEVSFLSAAHSKKTLKKALRKFDLAFGKIKGK